MPEYAWKLKRGKHTVQQFIDIKLDQKNQCSLISNIYTFDLQQRAISKVKKIEIFKIRTTRAEKSPPARFLKINYYIYNIYLVKTYSYTIANAAI